MVVPRFAGYGAQYNHHVYAEISREAGVDDENVLDMERKVTALRPQFVRIFFHFSAFADADRMQSFVRSVELAQRSASSINITWQSRWALATRNMARFAEVLADLVENRGIKKLKWVTIQNEPNATKITMDNYEQLYRLLDAELTRRGLRKRIAFMGGDLVGRSREGTPPQEEWFNFLATRMPDVLDAYSIHVYWNYWDTRKLEQRLTEVNAIRSQLPVSGQKPLYITEYGVRGRRPPDPGTYEGRPLGDTNINAFQHAWLALLAARLGYHGAVKWDAYAAKYDKGRQDYPMIGSPRDGWPLRPVYRVMRLLTRTVKPGWKIIGVEGGEASKLVAAFAGPKGQLTVLGLDTAGGNLNDVSSSIRSYEIAGLPANNEFRLLYWNRNGGGSNSRGEAVESDHRGLVRVEAPLHSVFALTTLAWP